MKDLRKTAKTYFVLAGSFLILTGIVLFEKHTLSYPCLGIVGGFTSLGACYLAKSEKDMNSNDAQKEN